MNNIRTLPLTEREAEVLTFIRKYQKRKRYSPTRKEIGEKFDITPQGAHNFLNALVRKNAIRIAKNNGKRITRNIEIIN